MSRTYRIRHLPAIGAKKFTDGNAGWYYRRQHEHYEALFEEYGDPQAHFYWKWETMRALERIFPLPAACKLHHPWVNWGRIGSVKTWYKQNGNRWARRRSRQLARMMDHDEEYDQRHPFPTRRQDVWDIWALY